MLPPIYQGEESALCLSLGHLTSTFLYGSAQYPRQHSEHHKNEKDDLAERRGLVPSGFVSQVDGTLNGCQPVNDCYHSDDRHDAVDLYAQAASYIDRIRGTR
jgi:hypothetical protein